MTEGAVRLLRRERDEIERLAESLNEGRRIVAFLVGPAAVRPAVLDHLWHASGVVVPEPVRLTDPDQTLDVLQQIDAGKPGEVRLLVLDVATSDVLRTLNWHREKLRRGASVLMWFDGVEGLRALRATAPDAYAFRDVLIAVEGEPPVTVIPPDLESVDVRLARMRHERAASPVERAEAVVNLAGQLMIRGSHQEARLLVEEALASIPADQFTDDEARVTRAGLSLMLAEVAGSLSEAWRCRSRGLAELAGIGSGEARRRRLLLLARSQTPLGIDHRSALQALGELRAEDLRIQVQRCAGDSWVTYGDFPRARELLQGSSVRDLSPYEGSLVAQSLCDLELAAGNLVRAEEHASSALDLARQAGTGTSWASLSLVSHLCLRGEHDAARRILAEIAAQPRQVANLEASVQSWLAVIALEKGDVAQALAECRSLLLRAVASRDDGRIAAAELAYEHALHSAHEASLLALADVGDAEREMDVAEAVALSISDDDPPWYKVLFPAYRAGLLALIPGRSAEAITLMTGALGQARALWPEASLSLACSLARDLLDADRNDEARSVLALAEPEAEAAGHLRHLSMLRAYAVAIMVRVGEPPAAVDRRMAILRATLEKTSAPRIVANTLRALARVLPPTAPRPDPLALLDEAHELYADMPIPLSQAHCLEDMGDVLAARGAAGARSRYLEALSICERYGFGLRIPLLRRKIGS